MTWKTFFSPAEKIAGSRALVWGVAGLAVCALCASLNGWHPNELLQFGPGSRGAFGIIALEYLNYMTHTGDHILRHGICAV